MMSRFFCLSVLLFSGVALAAADEYNYDESKIPDYTLPDPLVMENGKKVEITAAWKVRRDEILGLFEEHVYGKASLGRPEKMRFVEGEKYDDFLGGKATLQEIRILLFGDVKGPHLDLLVIAPKEIPEGGVPAFVALNFSGNHSIHPDKRITITDSWMRASGEDKKEGRVLDNKAQEKSRGFKEHRWAVEKIIDAGMALATFYYGDIDPDFDDGFENGIHAVTGKPAKNEWGSIGSWAWACSRVLDYLETNEAIDSKKVGVFGHSRLGKTALWAGATDQRFALTISNNSGCGGAALSRRHFGETVQRINTSFPHWFCDNFEKYNENEAALPVDQHQLISLIAPRPVYIASAEGDEWADPRGEFLSALHADPVYRLTGTDGLAGAKEYPSVNSPVGGTIRYHVRTGKHDVTDYDWEQYIKAMRELVVEKKEEIRAPGEPPTILR